MHADLCEFTGICGYNSQLLTNFYLRLTQPGAIGRILSPAMKLKRENTRSRLFLTLGLAVVLPALALIFVTFQHVKSIQRDKKVEGLIHRDFQYVLTIGAKKMASKGYGLAEEAREEFPSVNDSDDDKRKKLDQIVQKNPWFTHVFLYDGKSGIVVEPQPNLMSAKEADESGKMYSAWFNLEGPYLCGQLSRKPKPIVWMAGESQRANGLV